MPPAIGTKIELYNGSGVWGYYDGQVTDANEENVIVHFVPRPPGTGDAFTVVYSMPWWNALLGDGYLTIKGE